MSSLVRRRRKRDGVKSVHDEDPLGGVANLFDASIVFAVGIMVAAVQAFSIMQVMSPDSSFTITKKDNRTGEMEVIEKSPTEIKVKKVAPEKKSGAGTRLGIAYQLPDGTVIYVPEEELNRQ